MALAPNRDRLVNEVSAHRAPRRCDTQGLGWTFCLPRNEPGFHVKLAAERLHLLLRMHLNGFWTVCVQADLWLALKDHLMSSHH